MQQIVVVGAGFAGLACARKLSESGAEVTVLEARDRVGGRIWSEALANGEVIERGGEFVMAGFEVLGTLAAELGLELSSTGASFYQREIREPGAPDIEALAGAERRLVEHIQQVLDANDQPVSLAYAIDSSPLSAAEKRIIAARMSGTITIDVSEVDLSWVGASAPHDGPAGSDVPCHVVGGNQGIALAIARELGDAVRLNAAVVALKHAGGRVEVTLAGGETITADAAVVTVPPPLVRELSFVPELPAGQAKAYDEIGFGVASKLGLELAAAAAPHVVQEVSAPFSVYLSAAADGSDRRSLTGFAGSPAGQRRLGLGSGDHRGWVQELQRLMPEVQPTGEPVLTEWVTERWTKGSYSYRPLGWTAENEEQLRAPLGRIAFAGEHTAGDWAACMEGALRSGQRAAAEVVALLDEPEEPAPSIR